MAKGKSSVYQLRSALSDSSDLKDENQVQDNAGNGIDHEGIAGDLQILVAAVFSDKGRQNDGTVLGQQGEERVIEVDVSRDQTVEDEKLDGVAQRKYQRVTKADVQEAFADLV